MTSISAAPVNETYSKQFSNGWYSFTDMQFILLVVYRIIPLLLLFPTKSNPLRILIVILI